MNNGFKLQVHCFGQPVHASKTALNLLELETWPIKSIYTVITNCSRSNIFDLISKLIIFELFFTSLYEMSEEENQLNCQTHKVYVFSKAKEF